MNFSLRKIIDFTYSNITRRLYLYTAIIALFLMIIISLSFWSGNTLTMITVIVRFERTHTVSRVEAMFALLKYLEFQEQGALEEFHLKMAITQTYNKVFSSLIDLRKTKTDAEFVRILEDTFKEADHKTAVIIANRIKLLFRNQIFKKMVSYAEKANAVGENIKVLAVQAVEVKNEADRRVIFKEIEKLGKEFFFYETSFSKHCSDLSNEISTYVNYLYITLLILSIGFTGLLSYMIAKTIFQQAAKDKLILEKEIQERKQAVDSLRNFVDALENSTDAIGMTTPQGHHYYQNKAFDQLFGDLGKKPPDTVYVDKAVCEEVFKAIKSGGTWIGEVNMYSKGGQILDIDLRAYANKDEKGNIISLVGVHTDITERKQTENERQNMQNQLKRAEKMETIGTLAGGVAHDLNNILGAIVGYPDLMLDDIPPNSPLRKSLLAIKESGERAAAIVQDLLTLARRGISITEVGNLNTIIKRYLGTSEYLKLRDFYPNIQVETNLASDLLNIFGSPVHLTKVVMNLVNNAAEAMPGDGKIILSTENKYLDRRIKSYDRVEEGDYVLLTVADNGIGISEADLEKIFEPFYTKKIMGKSGTGLGMAVVWGTVKDHNGYIDVESEEGKGTSFKLYFPVTRKEVDNNIKIVPIDEYVGDGEKVLIIDDVKSQRDIALNMLKKLNYTVATIASGEEAVEYLKNNSADLLVLDMIMNPGMNGLETYKQILEIDPKQKAIIASGFSETDHVKEAQRLGAGAYIKKPYTLEKIGLAVKAELNKK